MSRKDLPSRPPRQLTTLIELTLRVEKEEDFIEINPPSKDS
jgi:hypothetical protein